jgi:hypothetical protein
MEWGKKAYEKLQGKRKKLPRGASPALSVNVLVLTCLATVAEAGVEMPDPVRKDLRLAIDYRKRVARFYESVSSVTTATGGGAKGKSREGGSSDATADSFARHKWLILQLERLDRKFSKVSEEVQKTSEQDNDHENSAKAAPSVPDLGGLNFHLLALSDDEDDGDEESADHLLERPRRPIKEPPTDEELEAEERTFAIALILAEISEARDDLKRLWRDYAMTVSDFTTDDDKAAELLAATACTEYTISALSKYFRQMQLEYTFFKKFDLQQLAESIRQHQEVPHLSQLTPGLRVTLRRLEKRPDLNGRHGKITQVPEGTERVGVELFPLDGYNNAETELSSISVKPDNLLLSDNAYLCLAQVERALSSFSFISCPDPPKRQWGAPMPPSLDQANLAMLTKAGRCGVTIKNGDYEGLLQFASSYVLPLWICHSRYTPTLGAADCVLVACLREFEAERRVTFQLALAVVIAMDCALEVANVNNDCAEESSELYARILERVFNYSIYKEAIDVLESKQRKPDALYSHFEFARHYQRTFHSMCLYFPWVSGELLQSGLRMHLVCATGLPWAFCQEYTTMLHLYWTLRTEGYLGRIAEIEASLIRMYRQRVWFRGGIPQKGGKAYVKSWQIAVGLNVHGAKLLDGQELKRSVSTTAASKAMEKTGLHVTEVSQLQDILQWKTMPILDRGDCYQQIQRIARDEYRHVYTAPLMSACAKLSQFHDAIGRAFIGTARTGGRRMVVDFDKHANRMFDVPVVCFWALALADDRAPNEQEKEIGLSLLANSFKSVFRVDDSADDVPSLTFSPNEHSVDPSLWGERGAKSPLYDTVV